MNKILAISNISLGVLCFVGMILLSTSVGQNTKMQQDIQQQQLTINKGKVTQQAASAIVKDLALLSLQDEEIKALLEKYGFTVEANQKGQDQ